MPSVYTQDVWRSVHELSYENEPSSENKGIAQIPSSVNCSVSIFYP